MAITVHLCRGNSLSVGHAEGGYEPRRSMNYVTGTVQPGPFDPSIEERIIGKVHELLRATAPR